ncbi:MAG: fructose-6-phosphate aldolase, partial [Oscillospiraceae bacterium]|nr:fructose-6-phosphate aldolase [Oscillospiraceae bacterium]
MKLCIDDANVEKIRRVYDLFPVDGVSTNPSILAKTGRKPYEVLTEIRSIVGEDGELFVQATSLNAEGMVAEARRIVSELGKTTLTKIPCVPEGFKAMKQLKKEGLRFIGTAIYTPMQGFLAAKCGAEYVAPYVNRIDNMGFDGVQVSKDIHDAITRN